MTGITLENRHLGNIATAEKNHIRSSTPCINLGFRLGVKIASSLSMLMRCDGNKATHTDEVHNQVAGSRAQLLCLGPPHSNDTRNSANKQKICQK